MPAPGQLRDHTGEHAGRPTGTQEAPQTTFLESLSLRVHATAPRSPFLVESFEFTPSAVEKHFDWSDLRIKAEALARPLSRP